MGSNNESLVRTYLQLRKAIGYLGILLPVVLPVGVLVLNTGEGWQPTISDYVSTVMEGVFVGFLFAIGVFLWFYEGYQPDGKRVRFEVLSDDAVGNIACICALGVALFPTNSGVTFVRYLHVIFATAMFLVLAYFSLVLFTKGSPEPTPRKLQRNRVYKICGITILACIALIGVFGWLLPADTLESLNPVFWLEAIALWAFGAAWFVKGEGLLADH